MEKIRKFVKIDSNMNHRLLVVVSAVLLLVAGGGLSARGDDRKAFREALSLYERGMFVQALDAFDAIPDPDFRTVGYSVLCAANLRSPGYEKRIDDYARIYPWSGMLPQITWRQARNLFDDGEFDEALPLFNSLSESDIPEREQEEFIFKKAYTAFETGDGDAALYGFRKIDALPVGDYTAPSRYASGYVLYERGQFGQALPWFEKAGTDPRFEEVSNYYVMECRYMMKDYAYVVEHGADMYDKVPEERKAHLARLISESYLVRGDIQSARTYFDRIGADGVKDRGDYFYAGSLLYAVKDYEGAIDNYTRMTDRSDSLGQVANYNLGYSYIQTKNKVAAMEAFKDAAAVRFDPAVREDAFFNYAKLAFDLGGDASVFDRYIQEYSDRVKGDRIYAYMALAALNKHDYAGAVEAYDQIETLDKDMVGNYMKAHYLRGEQLVRNGSWRSAVPVLKAAAYYADRFTPFNQLSRYWMAESLFRDDQFTQARAVFSDLYNLSALEGRQEGELIPYNIAYCYFKEGNYDLAAKWFGDYIGGKGLLYRKDAALRQADCYFARKQYPSAISAYNKAIAEDPDITDIYPYYQAAMAYGVTGNNARKIEMLAKVKDAPAEVPFYGEAMTELGAAYVAAGRDAEAEKIYSLLVTRSKEGSFVARGLIGLGMVYRNRSDFDRALDYYKQVVNRFPNTEYAADALLAIESIYQARQEPEKYLAYIDGLGGAQQRSEADKEEMLFNAAEQIYLGGNYAKAVSSLTGYQQRYPNGKHLAVSQYYLADSYRNLDRKEQARDAFQTVIDSGDGAFRESAILHYARLSQSLEQYDDALKGYEMLYAEARIESNRQTALLGLMRSAYAGKQYAEAVTYSNKVSAAEASTDADRREASYLRAKSLLATSQREKALTELRTLAEHPSSPEGAEATYLLIQDSFDRGAFVSVRDQVYAFSGTAGGQTYWLAKSFLLLGDTFAEEGEFKQARATFESIRDGYTPRDDADDVPEAVAMRLAKLSEMGN